MTHDKFPVLTSSCPKIVQKPRRNNLEDPPNNRRHLPNPPSTPLSHLLSRISGNKHRPVPYRPQPGSRRHQTRIQQNLPPRRRSRCSPRLLALGQDQGRLHASCFRPAIQICQRGWSSFQNRDLETGSSSWWGVSPTSKQREAR